MLVKVKVPYYNRELNGNIVRTSFDGKYHYRLIVDLPFELANLIQEVGMSEDEDEDKTVEVYINGKLFNLSLTDPKVGPGTTTKNIFHFNFNEGTKLLSLLRLQELSNRGYKWEYMIKK